MCDEFSGHNVVDHDREGEVRASLLLPSSYHIVEHGIKEMTLLYG